MKNVLCLIILLVCLCGCNAQISAPQTVTPSKDVSQLDYEPHTDLTVEEYSKHLDHYQSRFPNFISYDMLKDCGSFRLFVNLSRNGIGYSYSFMDDNQCSYNIKIYHGRSVGLNMDNISIVSDISDLRTTSAGDGYFYLGDIRYAFYEGKLYQIRWWIGEQEITIEPGTPLLHEYPIRKKTFLSQLLNAETAEAAVAEFNAKVAQARQEAQACRIIPTLRTLEEYEAYLSRFIEPSSGFIHYDMLKDYGELLAFRDGTYADWGKYVDYPDGRIQGSCSTYTYELLDPAGYTIVIYISPVSEYTKLLGSSKTLAATQSVHTLKEENGYYKFKDLYYGFQNGEMVQILIPYKQNMISVKRPDYQPFTDYPVENNTFVSKLLNTQTAEAAVAEFNAKVAQARAEKAG